jgi:hypothetical protein
MRDLMRVMRETRIVIKRGHIEFQGALAIIGLLLILMYGKDLIPLIFRS